MPAEKVKILVAIADVDAVIKNNSAIDQHARHNTTSVYTAAEIFPMLPEEISTNITSLNFNQERLAMVIEMVIGADGSLKDSDIYHAWVRWRPQFVAQATIIIHDYRIKVDRRISRYRRYICPAYLHSNRADIPTRYLHQDNITRIMPY
jgi:exoribonuclease II